MPFVGLGLYSAAEGLVGREEKRHRFPNHLGIARFHRFGRSRRFRFIHHLIDAVDLAREDFSQSDERGPGYLPGKNGGLTANQNAQSGRLEKVAVREAQLEEGLTRKSGVLGGQAEAAEIHRGHADGGHASDEGVFAIVEGGPKMKRFAHGSAAFQGRVMVQ